MGIQGSKELVTPVILSGGSGSRLWPLSRAMHPKQFLPLAGDLTMIQETAQRVVAPRFAPPLIICNEEHRFLVAEQLRAKAIQPTEIILEPTGRNTAPAACVAALKLLEADGAPLMLVMPSDHVIAAPDRFLKAVETATAAARAGALVTFGITPDRAEAGYGYIKAGSPFRDGEGLRGVECFVEKPDRATAEAYLADDSYFWNSGIFLFSAAAYLAELERANPAMVEACRRALSGAERDLTFCRLAKDAFVASPSDSIDYAVMEKTARAAMVPVDMGWNDVGAWSALWDIGAKDANGNVVHGDVVLHDARNVYVRSEDHLVAVTGLENVVVVATDDAILVTDYSHVQDVRQVVERLKADGRSEHSLHTTVYRPWGSYRSVDRGNRFQVKRIVVNPSERLSLQMHHHRAEHWIVVEGTALVTRGEEQILLRENESVYIPLGTVHRLENPGRVPLHLIEVQSGSYLGEDDIVRLEDVYGR
ncbi:mannose-1-phosphate guanylyltransferase/mannose-6-phosphate isomerase [Azospirillum formosense]|uniref:mannose-1-phosphate guanylyltransferase n=1 Tax=Azospirillum formosense TaxID=861533 RepID=A0ABX2KTV8_9PROT|nr:mannose-1-phosphate guanylyltransferase/mannose-6-phosphate isomerase [Azospirillum formosense]MBY3757675.1 mannose-1-phosphate guanylyltransferase/mannose-6-phosphate isomerase [Azospirillum formosense]NUB19540.1 mannose-1-phosphate guanylyltransferase/mannose-6-phosphate isomerase [Azospirillum formosense]